MAGFTINTDPSGWGVDVQGQCPAGQFWNQSTGACDSFSVGTAPPPLQAFKVPWAWWQILALVGALGGAGFLAFKGYQHYKSNG